MTDNNNIDNMVFTNHETYFYYSKPLLLSEHAIKLPPVFNDPDNVTYSSFSTPIYNNEKPCGTYKVNRFLRDQIIDNESITTFIGTFITPKGTLVINYAANLVTSNQLYVVGQNFVTYATYKSGDYAKYLYVKVSIDVSENNFRVVTISY